ncbi:MAG: nitroreductase [Deltaproteobacteria bacterium]|nr:nitroreductase [Deltaproteobacteria bacterium]
MDVLEVIKRRRTIKASELRSDPVPRALLVELLEAANWAPSHGKTYPWRFVVFEGPARRELFETLVSVSSEDGDVIGPADPRRAKLERSIMNAPVVIGVGCVPTVSPKILEHEEVAAVAMAVQNMHLVATERGLGLAWSSGKAARDPRVAAFFGLPEHGRSLGILVLGWPKGEWPSAERPSIEERVVWR